MKDTNKHLLRFTKPEGGEIKITLENVTPAFIEDVIDIQQQQGWELETWSIPEEPVKMPRFIPWIKPFIAGYAVACILVAIQLWMAG